jgi:carbon monoxide dehydrogenase subunit G
MQLNGDILILAPRPVVWSALNESQVLSRCITGCESMEDVGPDERRATVAVKVGPVRARFTGTVRMADVRHGEGCTLHFEGSGGAAGMAQGRSVVMLSDEGDGTRLQYTVSASVGGKLGQIGGRMIDAAAKQMADQFFEAFQRVVAPLPTSQGEAPAAQAGGAGADVHDGTLPAAPALAGAPAWSPAPDARDQPVVSASDAAARWRPSDDALRLRWFALGVATTAFGVVLGAWLF